MTEIRLHDTMAREKRVFTPADPGRVTMYVCGPTVYNRAHIGNARPAVVFDVLARLLRHVYGADSLVYARNVTDVDDKIIEAARAEGVDPDVVTKRYEDFYLQDMGALGVQPPDIAPHATAHVPQMITMIAGLIERGNAYEADGHVLFNVPSDPDYGALGRRDRDAMIAGARVEVASYKRDPADFVLWKPSPDGVIGWDSPWGRGRPGWHIECSAMIAEHLGETIDIHGGGLDLIFPHHENEIAQSRCAHQGAPLARYWVHNGFLSMAGAEKMSKSLGNVVTVGDLLAQGHKGDAIRMSLLTAHYRQPLEWSQELLDQATEAVEFMNISAGVMDDPITPNDVDRGLVLALSNDLNFPLALQRLLELAKESRRAIEGAVEGKNKFEEILHLQRTANNAQKCFVASASLLGFEFHLRRSELHGFMQKHGARVQEAIDRRQEARDRRDFAESDRIRDALAAEGVVLEDGPQGTSWRRA